MACSLSLPLSSSLSLSHSVSFCSLTAFPSVNSAVKHYGQGQWALVASMVGTGRNGKQCRERYTNHLDPTVNNAAWTTDEDELIMLLRAHIGNKVCLSGCCE